MFVNGERANTARGASTGQPHPLRMIDPASWGAIRGPATEPLTTYDAREQDGRIEIRV